MSRHFLPLFMVLPYLLYQSAADADTSGVLRPFNADYELTRNDIPVGQTRVSLELLPSGGYLYQAVTEPNAVMSLVRRDQIFEQSRGRIVNGRPRPDRYLYRRDGSNVERHLELEFDWKAMRVRNKEPQSTWSVRIPAGTLDKLVQQLVFTLDVKQGVGRVNYAVADGGKPKDYAYRTVGKETLNTPLGRIDTIKVNRSKNQGARDYTLWLAPGLGFRPVRILRRHGGSLYRMELVTLDLQPKY